MPEQTYNFTVREATEADYPGVIEALTNAFEYDPVMSKAMGGDGRTETLCGLFDFQIRTTYGPKGTIDIAVTEDGKVLGAALWLSPQAQKGNLLADLKALPDYYKVLGKGLIRAAFTEFRLLAKRPRFAHWYLYTIGVHEDARGHGIGSHLLDYRCERLEQVPAYLEASTYRSASLYARHGFVELFRFKSGKPALGMLHPAPVTQVSLHDLHRNK
ncbi:MAG: GNAT family N-acetyltransferase [Rothia sp. (in: high G+C Gram-positive bacteria)]|nr:GNAT family N-acetyltransferase [Rothia sp. (in: high G+C Gram-positive bacteria)]